MNQREIIKCASSSSNSTSSRQMKKKETHTFHLRADGCCFRLDGYQKKKRPDKFNKCPNHHKQKTRTTDDSPCTETGHNVIHQTNQKPSPTHTHTIPPLHSLLPIQNFLLFVKKYKFSTKRLKSKKFLLLSQKSWGRLNKLFLCFTF